MTSKPIAVLISDVHYNINSLPIADEVMDAAIDYGELNHLPVIVAGDLHDTKANMRGECVRAMIRTFSERSTQIIVIVGNHCLLNQRSREHSLEFLKPYVQVVDSPIYEAELKLWLIPYHENTDELQSVLSTIPKGSTIIMHQGVQTAYMGHYVQDKTSLPPEAFKDFRVISGHYHRAQDIKCGRPRKGGVGLFSYIGTPYTTSFAEALDGPKGFRILHEDGMLSSVQIDVRKHVILERTVETALDPQPGVHPDDLLWLKVTGPYSELQKLKKAEIGAAILGHSNFKLDLIRNDSKILEAPTKDMTDGQILDTLIENLPESDAQKSYLKELWREICD